MSDANEETPYNHDINVSPEFAAQYPAIKDLLRDDVLIKAFGDEDKPACALKKKFVRCGALSVVLTVLPLIMSPLIFGFHISSKIALAGVTLIDALGVTGLVLIITLRRKHFRDRWRLGTFVRERMRQWHFQLFLDGPFVEKASKDPAGFKKDLEGRWIKFDEIVRRGRENHFRTFVNAHAGAELYVEPKPYTDPVVARQVWEALKEKRLDYQGGYAGMQIDETGGVFLVPTPEKSKWIEAVATWTLFFALVFTVAFFALDVADLAGRVCGSDIAILGKISSGFVRAAILFTAVSAGARAFKSGYTVPEETESYEDYRGQIALLSRVYMDAKSDAEKLDVFKELEMEAARELRRFLKMKGRATFVA